MFKGFFNFRFVERISITIILSALVIDLLLVYLKGASIGWIEYAKVAALCLLLIIGGLIYRKIERSERIASTLICSALLVLFSLVMALYNYLLLPLARPPIDQFLTSIDAFFGFYWPDVMAWAASHPIITLILKLSYMTTMAQLSILIALLGLTGRQKQMDVLILTVIISATIAICFWGVFPSLGAKSLYQLSPEIWATVAPVVDQIYAEELKYIAIHGPGTIVPYEIRGLIAFPSYHASLAFVALFSSYAVKKVFPIFLVLNLLILPATLIHGGHHFVDPFAGFVLFLASWYIAKNAIYKNASAESLPEIVPA